MADITVVIHTERHATAKGRDQYRAVHVAAGERDPGIDGAVVPDAEFGRSVEVVELNDAPELCAGYRNYRVAGITGLRGESLGDATDFQYIEHVVGADGDIAGYSKARRHVVLALRG